MAISAVIFDAFGTTLRIGNPTPPYRQLLHEGAKHSRRPHPGDLHRLMVIDVGFQGAADLLVWCFTSTNENMVYAHLKPTRES